MRDALIRLVAAAVTLFALFGVHQAIMRSLGYDLLFCKPTHDVVVLSETIGKMRARLANAKLELERCDDDLYLLRKAQQMPISALPNVLALLSSDQLPIDPADASLSVLSDNAMFTERRKNRLIGEIASLESEIGILLAGMNSKQH